MAVEIRATARNPEDGYRDVELARGARERIFEEVRAANPSRDDGELHEEVEAFLDEVGEDLSYEGNDDRTLACLDVSFQFIVTVEEDELEPTKALVPEPIKTARRIRDVSRQNGANGTMVLYRVNPALESGYSGPEDEGPFEYVVASSVNAMFSGYETLVFPANEEGDVVSYSELLGMRGAEAEEVFADAGYEVIS